MKKYLIFGLLAGIMLALVGVALAGKPNLTPQLATVDSSGGRATVVIPQNAVEVAPGVFSLGTGLDYDGRLVEGYAFVDYEKGFGKPTGCKDDGVCQGWEDPSCTDCAGGGNGGGEPDTSSCYGFLSKGAKWKDVEDWIVNPSNAQGLTSDFVFSNLSADIEKWETAAGADILGGGLTTNVALVADTVSPDNQNEVYFADIASPGAIAVTIVWGIFRGPPQLRELVEWDQIYDDISFDWSASGETGKMDFENIATHELGHSVGLDDLYEERCSEQTMYGYAGYGETKKRDLGAGDIRGIQELYK